MKQHWTKFSAALLLAATAASAQNFSAVFDGAQQLKGFTPVSVTPVVRETKPQQIEAPKVLPVRAEDAPQAPVAAELIPLALELEVPADLPQTQAVSDRVARLKTQYSFYADPTFEPVRLVKFHILPFPPVSQPTASYLVRGVVPAPRVENVKADGMVRNVYQDRSVDAKALEEVLLRYGKSLRRERGVKDAYVGFDCGVQGEHNHIVAHHPAIVVETDGTVGVKAVRVSVLQTQPGLALEPIVFVQR
ncbi:MAG: hypothetical protein HY925_05095 [Elusimicrobia bacterium]|nr:hypothetical protein [Elusimicrobiota bacterium]